MIGTTTGRLTGPVVLPFPTAGGRRTLSDIRRSIYDVPVPGYGSVHVIVYSKGAVQLQRSVEDPEDFDRFTDAVAGVLENCGCVFAAPFENHYTDTMASMDPVLAADISEALVRSTEPAAAVSALTGLDIVSVVPRSCNRYPQTRLITRSGVKIAFTVPTYNPRVFSVNVYYDMTNISQMDAVVNAFRAERRTGKHQS